MREGEEGKKVRGASPYKNVLSFIFFFFLKEEAFLPKVLVNTFVDYWGLPDGREL